MCYYYFKGFDFTHNYALITLYNRDFNTSRTYASEAAVKNHFTLSEAVNYEQSEASEKFRQV